MSEVRATTILVSTIIPVYNGARSVAAAIDSALAQNFDGQEIIVINDGSTDGTAGVLALYGDRIRVIDQANRGAAAARNAGAAIARGRYVALLDCDDAWLPGHLARNVAALDRNPRAVLSFADVRAVDREGNEIPQAAFDTANLTLERMLSSADWVIYPSAVLMRRDALEACGGFSAEFRLGVGFEDPYMWFLMREQGAFVHVNQPSAVYRFPDFAEVADKYGHNLQTYSRLLRKRYGPASRPARRNASRIVACSLAMKAFREMEARRFSSALVTWARVLRRNPWFFVEDGNLGRLWRRKNLKRAAQLILGTMRGSDDK